jgi:hypothetical protein
MKIVQKINLLVFLPSLLIIGLGILEIKFPHAMNGFDDNYTGRGAAGFIMLLFELFLMLTWGKIEGIILILLGLLLLLVCCLPQDQQSKGQILEILETENEDRSSTASLSSLALKTGRVYLERRLGNRQP